MSTPLDEPTRRPEPLTDSPWFWVMLFSSFGMVAIWAMGPKYGNRQSQLERQYIARERAAAGAPTTGESPDGEKIVAKSDVKFIPLSPLFGMAAVVALFSSVMVARSRLRQQRESP